MTTQKFKTVSRMLEVKSLKSAASALVTKGWRRFNSWESDVDCVVSYYEMFEKETSCGWLELTLKKSFSL